MPKSHQIDDLPEMEPNSSAGTLIYAGLRAVVIYGIKGPEWPMNTHLVAVVTFDGCHYAAVGGPNDEALCNHPLYSVIGVCSMWQIEDTELIRERCRIHDRDGSAGAYLKRAGELHHYLLAFKENTIELMANGYRLAGTFPVTDQEAIWRTATGSLSRSG